MRPALPPPAGSPASTESAARLTHNLLQAMSLWSGFSRVTQGSRVSHVLALFAAAELWLERREELGFPLGQAPPLAAPAPPPLPAAVRSIEAGAAAADLVVEVGCEELPPDDAEAAVAQLRCRAPPALDCHTEGVGQTLCHLVVDVLRVAVLG